MDLETERDLWRETVRDIYDLAHLSPHAADGGHGLLLADEIVTIIEERHPSYFGAPSRDSP